MKQPDELGFEALRQVEEAMRPQRSGMRVVQATPKASWRSRLPRVSVAVQHFLFLGGLVSITVGSYMIYQPLGPIVGGVVAISLGLLLSTETDDKHRKPGAQGC